MANRSRSTSYRSSTETIVNEDTERLSALVLDDDVAILATLPRDAPRAQLVDSFGELSREIVDLINRRDRERLITDGGRAVRRTLARCWECNRIRRLSPVIVGNVGERLLCDACNPLATDGGLPRDEEDIIVRRARLEPGPGDVDEDPEIVTDGGVDVDELELDREDVRLRKTEDGPALVIGRTEILLRTFLRVEDEDGPPGERHLDTREEVDCDGDNGCWFEIWSPPDLYPAVTIQPEVRYLDDDEIVTDGGRDVDRLESVDGIGRATAELMLTHLSLREICEAAQSVTPPSSPIVFSRLPGFGPTRARTVATAIVESGLPAEVLEDGGRP